mmetsp:Transcript_8152/g.17447  ORF Transcript_8152/g.17447 Transcript_8152/m.17447 type:complete len:233 (+) Transcript_8152:459-1157(+)
MRIKCFVAVIVIVVVGQRMTEGIAVECERAFPQPGVRRSVTILVASGVTRLCLNLIGCCCFFLLWHLRDFHVSLAHITSSFHAIITRFTLALPLTMISPNVRCILILRLPVNIHLPLVNPCEILLRLPIHLPPRRRHHLIKLKKTDRHDRLPMRPVIHSRLVPILPQDQVAIARRAETLIGGEGEGGIAFDFAAAVAGSVGNAFVEEAFAFQLVEEVEDGAGAFGFLHGRRG